jgi:hypothetical protein
MSCGGELNIFFKLQKEEMEEEEECLVEVS